MRTIEQVNYARAVMRKRVVTPGLTDVQKSLVIGMLNALVWVADGEASFTMKRMLSDEPLAPGKDHTKAMELLDKVADDFRDHL